MNGTVLSISVLLNLPMLIMQLSAVGLTFNIKHFIGLKSMGGQLYHLGDNSNFVYYIGSLTINSVLTLLTGASFPVSVLSVHIRCIV